MSALMCAHEREATKAALENITVMLGGIFGILAAFDFFSAGLLSPLVGFAIIALTVVEAHRIWWRAEDRETKALRPRMRDPPQS
jgi:hypothetical protein